ncbi:MAG TPA: maleylpyruvate isomerase family mycothiol-dependent enzyme [Nitriliruptorales bacterium]
MTYTELVDALEQTWAATSSFASTLTDREWELPTGCPGWTVKDNVSHLIGMERVLLGEPQPDHDLPDLPDLPHVRDDIGRFMEVDVDLRRPVDPADVLAEFDDVRARRIGELRSVPDADLETEITGLLGAPAPAKRVLPIRVFDCWAHDQDIRRAVGRPGNQTGLPAEVSIDRLTRGIRHNLPQQLGLTDDVVAVFAITEPEPRTVAMRIGPDGAELLAQPPADPDVLLELDLDTFVVLGCGREGYADVIARGQVRCRGDVQLADRIVKAMPVTP